VWEFEKGNRQVNVRVEGQLVFNTLALRIQAATAGLGLTYVPEDEVSGLIAAGKLVRVLADWCPSFPGYHLYYPSRRQPTAAFSVIVDALRHRRWPWPVSTGAAFILLQRVKWPSELLADVLNMLASSVAAILNIIERLWNQPKPSALRWSDRPPQSTNPAVYPKLEPNNHPIARS
jgi:hypothetical protein